MFFGITLTIEDNVDQQIEIVKTLIGISPETKLRDANLIARSVVKAVSINCLNGSTTLCNFMDLLIVARNLFVKNDVHAALDIVASPKIVGQTKANAVASILHMYFEIKGYAYHGEPHPVFDY